MPDNGLISVILPIYKVAAWLPRCLTSIQENSYKNLEIICVNDGSPDNSLEILESFAKQDNRIIIVNKPNGGVASARNDGLDIARGEFISFIDPDDWVHEKYFEYLHRLITEENADVAICNHIRTSEKTVLPDEVAFSKSLVSGVEMVSNHKYKIYIWDKLYRHELIGNLREDKTARFDDTTFVLDLFIQNPSLKAAYVDAELYAYFIREGSLASAQGVVGAIVFAERFAAQLNPKMETVVANIIATEAVKRALSAVAVYRSSHDWSSVARCNSVIKQCLPYITGHKTRYKIITRFPILYQAWRILCDPTMLKYYQSLGLKLGK